MSRVSSKDIKQRELTSKGPSTLGFPHKKLKFFKTSQNSGRTKTFLD